MRRTKHHTEEGAHDRPVAGDTHGSGYVISVAANRAQVHAQTLRHYERIGLITPSRTPGNIRLYSDSDLERVRQVQRLVNELGVNLAGVEVILNLTDRLEKQREEVQAELAAMQQRYEAEIARLKRIIEQLQAGQRPQPTREVPAAERLQLAQA